MRHSIDTYIAAIAYDNKKHIIEAGYNSIADYLISTSDYGNGWYWAIDHEEYADYPFEPSEEQIDEVKEYLRKYYDYLPD